MELKDTLVSQIPELGIYLDYLGYESPDCSKDFFKLIYAKPELSKKTMSELEPYLAPLIVKNEKERKFFHSDLQNFIKKRKNGLKELKRKKQQHQSECDFLEQQRMEAEQKLRELQKQIQKGEKKDKQLLTEKKYDSIKKKYSKCKKDLSYLVRSLKDLESPKIMNSILNQAKNGNWEYTEKDLERVKEVIRKLLISAVKKENYKAIMDYLMEVLQLIKNMEDYLKDQSYAQKKIKMEMDTWERKMTSCSERQKRKEEQFQKDIDKILEKERSFSHREEFGTTHRPVHTQIYSGEIEDKGILSKELNKLNDKEKRMIYDYIRENARQFKERFSRNIRSDSKHQINISETCKKACETNGIPFRLVYQKPAKERTKMVIFLDVSGSCKEVSELMLIFMYFMQDLFPGGCKLYAFINSLYDISGFMEAKDCSEAAKSILASIPRAGAYSDYNRPFKDIYENHYNEITSDTITFFIGDARNNKNPSGEEYVKAIARKSKKCYWMNPDMLNKWGQGDSIIWTYAPYMTHLGKVSTPAELIHFLTEAG